MNCGKKMFGGVRVEWRCDPRGPGCRVEIWWLESLIVTVDLNRTVPAVPFSAITTEDQRQSISGQLIFRGGQLLLDLKYPNGQVEDYPLWPSMPPTPPTPPPTPPHPDEEIEALIEGEGEYDLFPYIFMRHWPSVSDTDLENRFVSYASNCDQHPDSLYCSLKAINNDRLAMEDEAVMFIEGGSPDEGQFLGTTPLRGPIAKFAKFDLAVRARPRIDLAKFKAELVRLLSMRWKKISWEKIEAYVRKEGGRFEHELDRTWQNLFALTIILGYDRELLADAIRTVVMATLIRGIADSSQSAKQWTSEVIQEGARATVILPDAIFPLPPATHSPPDPPGPRRLPARTLPRPGGSHRLPPPGIVPYAIGDLQLVRQHLARYELGEVSHIDNVLKGECKETTRRNLNRRSESATEQQSEALETSNDLDGTRADLLSETRKTLWLALEIHQETQYGPPHDGKATGSLTVPPNKGENKGKPQRKDVEEATRFARNITARTANRIARQASRKRTVATLDEQEQTVVTRFDAGDQRKNVTGIYRWVNKVYRAWVVNYGERLIIELLIPRPARAYVSGEQRLQGLTLSKPVALAALGVHTFRDISRHPAKPGYYAALAARYDASDITPPPPESKIAGTTFQSGADVLARELRVPEGYRAEHAYVTVNWGEQADPLRVYGIVGREPFELESPDSKSGQIMMNQESAVVPVAIAASEAPASPPESKVIPAIESYLATVEVGSILSEEKLETWKLETYNAITAAYRQQSAEYYSAAGANPSGPMTRNPLASRETIRRTLREDAIRLLLRKAATLTGEAWELWVGEPRYIQFFEQAFEWSEMSYSFTARTGDTPDSKAFNTYQGEDELFTAFLQAGLARVLLPVRPSYSFTIPYFLTSGMIWDGPDSLTPANQGSVSLINEIKSAEPESERVRSKSKPWEIKVPTSMVMLQDSQKLPGLE